MEALLALASWSTKRILTLWAGGVALQAVLVLAPTFLARRLIAGSSELVRTGAERDARWRSGDLADSMSLLKQRADARAARTYSVTANGDTLFPLVRVPSGRPDPAAIASFRQRTRRNARYVVAGIFGLVPSLLLFVTLFWLIVRRKDVGAAASFGTS
jgi:hypothetical protein